MDRSRWLALLVPFALLVGACTPGDPASPNSASARTAPTVPPPTSIASGDPAPEAASAVDALFADPLATPVAAVLATVGRSRDVRLAWYLVDLLRFQAMPDGTDGLVAQLETLTDTRAPAGVEAWSFFADLLMVWDVPAPPGYAERKRALLVAHDPGAADLVGSNSSIDWRFVSASGAKRDGVVQLDDPEVVPAEGGGEWLPDDDAVVGVTVGSERRAYPLRVLATHEIINDTVGGRRIVVTYCAFCGSVIGWYADGFDDLDASGTLEFHSSGLVMRGASLLYDVSTQSLFDPFVGTALSGPMLVERTELEPLAVVDTTWEAWRSEHPQSTVVADDGGVGRIYLDVEPADPAAPAWPIGSRDARLDSDDIVFGVVNADGDPVAFPLHEATGALVAGDPISWRGVRLELEAGGLTATVAGGDEPLAGHQAYWFAWSQFQGDTELWEGGS